MVAASRLTLLAAALVNAEEDALCASHAACSHLAPLDGLCCPVADGTRLACCDEVPAAPAVQTATQRRIWSEKAAAAKAASEAATPAVLEFFDSPRFRAAVAGCCPEIAALEARDILERYRAEVRAAELAHSFPASAGEGHFVDLTIDGALEYSWFINEVQARILSYSDKPRDQDEIEEALFGCEPYARAKHPTWSEAADRLIYVAHNMRQVDTGSLPTFGDVAAVFDYEYVRKSVLIAPMDTGIYWMKCVEHEHMPWSKEELNCTAWADQVVGTLDHFDHLILPNLALPYNSSVTNLTIYDGAKALFSHSAFAGPYEDRAPITQQEMMHYWEPNILGNPRLPESVRFLVGNFATLFGTKDGLKLQSLAAHYAWPLFWAFGFGSDSSFEHGAAVSGNERLLDPSSAPQTNASVPVDALASFKRIWEAATETRAGGTNGTWAPEDVRRSWDALLQGQLRVAPLSASSCADLQGCVATAIDSRDCVCKVSQEAALV